MLSQNATFAMLNFPADYPKIALTCAGFVRCSMLIVALTVP